MKDLDKILVVSVEHAVAAPYASSRLADAGARTIKVERPEGDFARGYDSHVHGESAYFVWLNRGKESIALDLKDQEDQKILHNILARADIFIQNLAPGALAKLGFDPQKLRKRYPCLIICSISGYGESGPRSQQKAYDLLIQAESGLCTINGTEHGSARVGISVCDIAAGMSAHSAILQALFARERDKHSQGRTISVSLYHALADWMNVPYLQHHYGGKTPSRMGLKHPSIAPYGAFKCKDGSLLLISIQNEREWRSLCTLLGEDLFQIAGFRNNNERVDNRQQVDEKIATLFAKYEREELVSHLHDASIAFGRLSSLEDLVEHPQNIWVKVDTGSGPVQLLSPAAIVNGQTRVDFGAVPDFDEQGTELRQEFGATHK